MPKKTKRNSGKPAAGKGIMAWQDDPDSGLPAIQRPVPDLSKKLAFRIKGPAYPAAVYPEDTPQFRYWTAAEALRRGSDFWTPLLNVSSWHPGAKLTIGLDEGEDLNAYYNRQELAFFHEAVQGKTYFSGESPDVVWHEMGHACLDAHRPELWDTPFIEVGALHESFGDQSAILSQLQLPGVRAAALQPLINLKASPLSRCAEQLGNAIRLVDPPAVDPDCLRNAYNKFKYVDPQTLPTNAPATHLSAEIHNFSRVFTGAFYDILSGMLKVRSSKPTDADLVAVALDYAKLLLTATAEAPVQPNYFAQVAAHMIDADTATGSKYRQVLTSVFVNRNIVPKTAVAPLVAHKGKVPSKGVFGISLAPQHPATIAVHKVELSGDEFGLSGQKVIVHAPVEHKPYLMVAAAIHSRAQVAQDVEAATRHFVKVLLDHDRVDTTSRSTKVAAGAERTRATFKKTHVLIETREGMRLVRRLFHCGCCV